MFSLVTFFFFIKFSLKVKSLRHPYYYAGSKDAEGINKRLYYLESSVGVEVFDPGQLIIRYFMCFFLCFLPLKMYREVGSWCV